MNEFLKVTSVLFIAGGVLAGAISWVMGPADVTTWVLRVFGPIAAVAFLGLFLYLHFRRDHAPDFLRDKFGDGYLNRGGFCFAMSVDQMDGFANLHIHFQNQFDRACEGRIALRPARGFWLTRAQMEWITLEIACPPAGFGVITLPFAIPLDLQGARQSFEVGASVDYPDGKGKQVRFRDGVAIRANADFQNSMGMGLAIAGATTGQIVLVESAKVTLDLPRDVAPEIDKPIPPMLKVLWKLGDEARFGNAQLS